MYHVFDSLVSQENWTDGKPRDLGKFFEALAVVANLGDFSPDAMGCYMIDKRGTENGLGVATIEWIDARVSV